jgi:signal transduction histidine kinase
MELSNKKHKRILILFLFGIGLPSLLLGYLAFRGIQNDQALLEKERREEHQNIADLITESIDENIFEIEEAFLHIITSQQKHYKPALIHSLDSLKHRHPLVEVVFYLQDLEKIQFPFAKLLFLSNDSTHILSTSSRIPSSDRNVQIAQQYEFQQKKYRKALVSYQQVFAKVSDRETKGELLSAIGRVQKKSGLIQDAIKSYHTIVQDYSLLRIAEGIPLGLIAGLELGNLFLAIKDSSSAAKTFIELYKDLINRKWTLEKAQYGFFEQVTKKMIGEIISQASLPIELQPYQSTYRMLKEEEKRHRKITDKLLTFQESAVKDLQAKISQNLEYPHIIAKRFTLETGGYMYLVSLISQNSRNGNQVNEIWGLLLDTDFLKNNLLHQTLQRYVLSEKTEWIIKGRDGKAILEAEKTPKGSITVKTNFAGNFPPWSIEFYQQEPRLFETFLTSRRGIYFYMFFLIAGILIFGLTFAIRAVTHELELTKMKSDFVSTISHEFKSPLTSILQLAVMLKTKRVPSEARRQRYYDVLVEQSERLSLLIDNILDFTKMEEGKEKFEFEIIDISELLHEIVSTIQDRVRHEGFIIQAKICDYLPSIKVDRRSISQAINNLIDNAIKYSDKKKQVNVHAFIEKQHLIITIQDYGIGIKKEETNKVFERFYRGGDELTRKVKGSGLGLTLVKQIVEAHHGNIQVESEPERGSTFSIKLPLPLTKDESKAKN